MGKLIDIHQRSDWRDLPSEDLEIRLHALSVLGTTKSKDAHRIMLELHWRARMIDFDLSLPFNYDDEPDRPA